jgi:hypothetical protein
MTDGERRFLGDLAQKIQADRVIQAHLFPAIRRGPIESGLAVLALADDAARDHCYAVVSANYRFAVKGMDRGTWTFQMRPEAEAPLDAIADVVRGVERRAGDWGVVGARCLDGDAFRTMLGDLTAERPIPSL